jgi:multicomponent Na+:H+ antiporter subunit D
MLSNEISSELAILFILGLPIFSGSLGAVTSLASKHLSFTVIVSSFVSLLLLNYADIRASVHIAPGVIFSLDRYSQLFVVLVNLAWMVCSIYSVDYLKFNFSEKANQFHTHLSLAVSAILATGLSENILTLIISYTLSGISILPLLTKFKFKHQKIVRVYCLNVLIPPLVTILPVSYFLGILTVPFDLLHIRDLNLTDVQASLLLAGFIIFFSKNSIMPFHLWLPKSSFAPAPVSALVHTVGAVQTGTIAILKIGHYVYGDNYLYNLNNDFFKTGWLTYLCGFTSLYTAFRAWKTTNLKERFSFSTVGQVSYIITAILVGTPACTLGAILHVITHSLAKMTLFFNSGPFSTTFKSTETHEIAEIAPSIPWVILTTAIAGLSITGFPLLAGYYSKDLMLIEEIHTHHYAAAFFLITGSFINFLYIYPIIQAGFWPWIKKYVFKKNVIFLDLKEKIPFSMKVAIFITTLGTLLFSQYIYIVSHIFEKL